VRPVTDLVRATAPFRVVSDFSPSGDQPAAIDEAHRRQIEKAEDAEAAEMSS